MSIGDEIRKLETLRQEGALTQEEFQRAKDALLAAPSASPVDIIGELGKRENLWAALLHLSPLLAYLIPVAGIVAPIVMWQMKKESPTIDQHGRVVMNWLISQLLWLILSALLCLLLVGIPMLWIFGILVVVFPVIGAVKAYEGRVWSYPLTIRFFKES
jgi:uncharacterized Tic20 family protein